jgi:hypothetical protein
MVAAVAAEPVRARVREPEKALARVPGLAHRHQAAVAQQQCRRLPHLHRIP